MLGVRVSQPGRRPPTLPQRLAATVIQGRRPVEICHSEAIWNPCHAVQRVTAILPRLTRGRLASFHRHSRAVLTWVSDRNYFLRKRLVSGQPLRRSGAVLTWVSDRNYFLRKRLVSGQPLTSLSAICPLPKPCCRWATDYVISQEAEAAE